MGFVLFFPYVCVSSVLGAPASVDDCAGALLIAHFALHAALSPALLFLSFVCALCTRGLSRPGAVAPH